MEQRWHIREDGTPERCSAPADELCTARRWVEYGHFDSEQAAKDFFEIRAARHWGGRDGNGGTLVMTPEQVAARQAELLAERRLKLDSRGKTAR